jgi:hypothetical protein
MPEGRRRRERQILMRASPDIGQSRDVTASSRAVRLPFNSRLCDAVQMSSVGLTLERHISRAQSTL